MGWKGLIRGGAWLALLLVLVHAQPGRVHAEPAAQGPIVLDNSRSRVPVDGRALFWIDSARHESPQALEAAGDALRWRVREAGTGYRLDGGALWFRFDVINRSDQRWYVEAGSSGIDRIQFFHRAPDGRWVVQEAGDAKAVPEWPLPGRLPAFELAGRADEPVRYWLRVEHERVDFASPIQLRPQGNLFAGREAEQFLLGGYFSLAALIFIGSVVNAVAFRDRYFAVYAIYVAMIAAGQLAYLGVGAQHIWSHWLHWNAAATFTLPGISAAAALWFVRTVTEPQRFSRALDVAVWALIAALLSAIALDLVAPSRPTYSLVLALVSLALVVIVLLIGVVWVKGDDPWVRLIALGFLPVLVMAVFPILRGFNLIPFSPLTRYGVTIGAALEMPILFYALSLRGARRREAAVRAAALSHNDALTGLAHTRTFLRRLDGALERCAALKHACALLSVKVANHDAVIAQYGRETADRVLVVAASLVRNVAADVDLAARVGDQQFALLLEGPATAQDASSRAQQLVASGLRESPALPRGLVLKFHVALALLPDRQLDAEGSLRWLTDAVNAIHHDSRKLIRALNF